MLTVTDPKELVGKTVSVSGERTAHREPFLIRGKLEQFTENVFRVQAFENDWDFVNQDYADTVSVVYFADFAIAGWEIDAEKIELRLGYGDILHEKTRS